MTSFMSYFGARRDPKQAARDAIVNLRQQLQMIDKKEEHLHKKMEEETKKAQANAVSNKTGSPSLLTFGLDTGILILSLMLSLIYSGYRCAETEEAERSGAQTIRRKSVTPGNAGEYIGSGEHECRDNVCNEESCRCAENHTWKSVEFSFPNLYVLFTDMFPKKKERWTKWTQRWLLLTNSGN